MESLGKLVMQGGFTMFILVACSILLLAVVFERIYVFWKNKVDPDWLLHNLSQFLRVGQFKEAQEYLLTVAGWLPRVMEAGLLRHELSKSQIEEAMEADIAMQGLAMDKNVNIIGTLAVIAPFVGLFGTVLGIIRAFQDIALKGQTGPEVVSKGVAEALIATAAGLFVAITAVIFYNLLKGRIRLFTAQMRVSATRLSEMLELKKEGREFPALAGAPAPGQLETTPAQPQQVYAAPPAPPPAPAYQPAPAQPAPQAYPTAPAQPYLGVSGQGYPPAAPAPVAQPSPAYRPPLATNPPAPGAAPAYRPPAAPPPYNAPMPGAQRPGPGQPPPYGGGR